VGFKVSDVNNKLSSYIADLIKLDLNQVSLGLGIGGGLPAFYKGLGVGLTAISMVDPLLLHFHLIEIGLGPVAIGVTAVALGVAFLTQHIFKTYRKYKKVRATEEALNKLIPVEQFANWHELRDKHQLAYNYDEFWDPNKSLDEMLKECEKQHKKLLRQLDRAYKEAVKDAAKPKKDQVLSKETRRMMIYAKSTYETEYDFRRHETLRFKEKSEKKTTPWQHDYRARADDFLNVILGLVFGWSLYNFLAFKVLTAATIATIIPGGIVPFMIGCMVMGMFFQMVIGGYFKDQFKEHKGEVNRKAAVLESRREIVFTKFAQGIKEKELAQFSKEFDKGKKQKKQKALSVSKKPKKVLREKALPMSLLPPGKIYQPGSAAERQLFFNASKNGLEDSEKEAIRLEKV